MPLLLSQMRVMEEPGLLRTMLMFEPMMVIPVALRLLSQIMTFWKPWTELLARDRELPADVVAARIDRGVVALMVVPETEV